MQISLLQQFDPSSWDKAERSGRGRSYVEGEFRVRGRGSDRERRGIKGLSNPVGGVRRTGALCSGKEKGGEMSSVWAGAGCQVFFLVGAHFFLLWFHVFCF